MTRGSVRDEKRALLGLEAAEISSLLPPSAPAYTARQIKAFCLDGREIAEMTSLPKSLRETLSHDLVALPLETETVRVSADGSKKYLFRFLGGDLAEAVYIPHDYGASVCVSTQIGCKMGCAFCASGKEGFKRDLDPAEMLAEVVAVNRDAGGTAKKRAVSGVVLMGSGEPLDNYDNVREFVRLLTAEDGFGLSERSVTLSTSGLADGIRKLADDGSRMTLSVSLHATTDEARSAIMPVNRRYPIGDVVSAARYYFEKTGRRVTFEYTLISGVNDSPADAERLTALLRGFPAHVNLIRLNAVEGSSLKATTLAAAARFAALLTKKGLPATVRRSLGSDIEGACGQLKRRYTGEDGE